MKIIHAPRALVKHLGVHWPGYGVVGLGGLLAYKKLKKKKPVIQVQNANT